VLNEHKWLMIGIYHTLQLICSATDVIELNIDMKQQSKRAILSLFSFQRFLLHNSILSFFLHFLQLFQSYGLERQNFWLTQNAGWHIFMK